MMTSAKNSIPPNEQIDNQEEEAHEKSIRKQRVASIEVTAGRPLIESAMIATPRYAVSFCGRSFASALIREIWPRVENPKKSSKFERWKRALTRRVALVRSVFLTD